MQNIHVMCVTCLQAMTMLPAGDPWLHPLRPGTGFMGWRTRCRHGVDNGVMVLQLHLFSSSANPAPGLPDAFCAALPATELAHG
ncbi:MAG: hypothetical protein LBJ40_13895 [Delftia acidovorans]|jgi:hypothetical protein|nr:hypothetical protein [Delftia acidovorans]